MAEFTKYSPQRFHWFKVFADKVLRGDVRLEKPITRDVFFLGLLPLAAESPYENDDGNRVLQLASGLGITDEQYCTILNITMEEWLIAKSRLEDRKSIKVDDGSNIITIINWKMYQTRYEQGRSVQLRYRKKLRKKGFKNYGEAFHYFKGQLEKHSSPEEIFKVLKFLPEKYHDDVRKLLDKTYPDGHSYMRAKLMYGEYKKGKKHAQNIKDNSPDDTHEFH